MLECERGNFDTVECLLEYNADTERKSWVLSFLVMSTKFQLSYYCIEWLDSCDDCI